MDYKDYYNTLGVERSASPDDIKRAYRKLARKYHPDVSKETDAEARFKEVAEAYEALNEPQRRAAYDAIGQRRQAGPSEPPSDWRQGFDFAEGSGMPGGSGDAAFSDFFESLFGRSASPFARRAATGMTAQGGDHHAEVEIDLREAYQGTKRTLNLRVPHRDTQGQFTLQEKQLDVTIPKGLRPGQHLRLAGQGSEGMEGGAPGDLYLEIKLRPDPKFWLDEADVYVDLPVAPWEAALGAEVTAPTPLGDVILSVPANSLQGRKLRLKGKGLPGKTPGDLYVVLNIALPPPASDEAKNAYQVLARAFPDYDPRTTTVEA
ncbi:MAG TPA: DnaJ C-terminal domain-containing protein [Burkholderiaceae bacterium]